MLSLVKGMIPRPFKRTIKRIMQNFWESAAYRFTRERTGKMNLRHVVFVCKGNICRSAFAEYYMRALVPGGAIRIESCGLDIDQGTFSPPEAERVAREFGIWLDGHSSKSLAACDLEKADLIVPMEYRQYLRLSALFPNHKGKIKLLRDFAPWPARLICNIYDPFGLGDGEYRRCFRRMQYALDGLKKQMTYVDSK